jgi:hypothetical protein
MAKDSRGGQVAAGLAEAEPSCMCMCACGPQAVSGRTSFLLTGDNVGRRKMREVWVAVAGCLASPAAPALQ